MTIVKIDPKLRRKLMIKKLQAQVIALVIAAIAMAALFLIAST